MVVAGTNAAGVVLPHLARQLITLHAQRADIAAQAGDPGGWPTLMCQVLTTRARYRGPGRRRPCWPRPWTRTARHRSPASLLRRPGTGNQEIRLLHKGRARLPRRQQEAQTRHVPVRLRLTALRPRQPGLLPAQTRPRQTALGQAVLALAHRRILTLHAMIRNHTLYTPQPSTQLPAAA